ncbi:kinase-like domain-containing protein [Hyaloraphidium curvatum]|nr:kinase-like domain-containing protein [Hyaloraphidium curvatum]
MTSALPAAGAGGSTAVGQGTPDAPEDGTRDRAGDVATDQAPQTEARVVVEAQELRGEGRTEAERGTEVSHPEPEPVNKGSSGTVSAAGRGGAATNTCAQENAGPNACNVGGSGSSPRKDDSARLSTNTAPSVVQRASKSVQRDKKPLYQLTVGYKTLLESCQAKRTNKRPYRFTPASGPVLAKGALSLASASAAASDPDPFVLPNRGPNNNGYDDVYDDYVVVEGEVWLDRYTLGKPLGRGSFGQVVEAFDSVLGKAVAIKIIKSRPSFTNQGKIELRILQHMNAKDPEDSNCIVRLLCHFSFRNHLCLVYEVLCCNLYELLRIGNFAGMSLNLVRKFGYQIALALRFLAREDVRVLHCDLKPENILLRDPKKALIKIIDFGSSCFVDERAYTYIQSRFYRAPEVILGAQYSNEIDMWSLGCILAELYTGQPLFCGQNEADQICSIRHILGPLPAALLDNAHAEKIRKLGKAVGHPAPPTGPLPLRSIQQILESRFRATVENGIGPDAERRSADFAVFVDLIERLLRLDPKQRLQPVEALLHPFFRPAPPAQSATRNGATAATLRPAGHLRQDQ